MLGVYCMYEEGDCEVSGYKVCQPTCIHCTDVVSKIPVSHVLTFTCGIHPTLIVITD